MTDGEPTQAVVIIRTGNQISAIVGPFPSIKAAMAYGNRLPDAAEWGWALIFPPPGSL